MEVKDCIRTEADWKHEHGRPFPKRLLTFYERSDFGLVLFFKDEKVVLNPYFEIPKRQVLITLNLLRKLLHWMQLLLSLFV